MIQLHFDIKQLKIGATIRILQLFLWSYVKYMNMEFLLSQSVQKLCKDIFGDLLAKFIPMQILKVTTKSAVQHKFLM